MTIHQSGDVAGGQAQQEKGWTTRLIFSFISMAAVAELVNINYTMIGTALPQISGHFHTTQGAWLISAFLLAGAVLCPLFGKLADLFGKRRMLLVALLGATLGAVVAAVAPNYGVLIAGRALQGMLLPCMFLTYSLMRDVYPPRILTMAASLSLAGIGLVYIPSPFLTGWLLDTWGYRSIFWFYAIVTVVLLAAIRLSTEETPLRAPGRLDLLGALLLGGGLAGVLAGVSFGPTWGWGAARTLGFIIGGCALLAIWVLQALMTRDPLIDLRIFRRRSVFFIAMTSGLGSGGSAVFTTMLPMTLMVPAAAGLGYGFGVSPYGLAVYQVPIAIGSIIAGYFVGRVVVRIHPAWTMALSQVLLFGSAIGIAFVHDTEAPLIIWTFLQGLGIGLTFASYPNLVIRAVPHELQGSMSSMVQVFVAGIGAIMPVVAFTVLNSHIATVAGGAALYTNDGIRIGFLIAAGASVAGLVFALLLPRSPAAHASADGRQPSAAEESAPAAARTQA